MDKKELKQKLHEQIEAIEDEKALQMFHEVFVDFVTQHGKDFIDEFSPDQKSALEEAIKQADEERTISHEEAMKRISASRITPSGNKYK